MSTSVPPGRSRSREAGAQLAEQRVKAFFLVVTDGQMKALQLQVVVQLVVTDVHGPALQTLDMGQELGTGTPRLRASATIRSVGHIPGSWVRRPDRIPPGDAPSARPTGR